MHPTLVIRTLKNCSLTPVLAATSTAWILSGAWAHGQEMKTGVQLPHTAVVVQNAQRTNWGPSGFDFATLPSIESIDAQTDLSVFLQRGAPDQLRLAALRRAWTVDRAIRDFKGPQENDWNFNDTNSVPGFGELSPDADVKKMVAETLGETPRFALAR